MVASGANGGGLEESGMTLLYADAIYTVFRGPAEGHLRCEGREGPTLSTREGPHSYW